ncbi:hypothetical protein NG796_12835 [Laspinema sp. A4]|uniref:hypothetical protein n=1 Tax=Laspinema sp. D2d TaxID=2953686 RepID=UPI0021BA4907|nr:hypothetical protein [Laspinema sp. D2d]MCT7984182.1 hypothetical protein [Laspinema sp. D2d]
MNAKIKFNQPQCVDIFIACHRAIIRGALIQRTSLQDKEFHFQKWFENRLEEAEINYKKPGRNLYPDFILTDQPEGYEIKGLAFPGRSADYDCNSQVPIGDHKERTIYYVFGRYPAHVKENEYPVLDLVICHGDFLNADRQYVHKNKSLTGFGSYGDLKIRDRKMYIAPTPYGIITGTEQQITLIIPDKHEPDPRLNVVGELVRVEADQQVIGYSFDLRSNTLTPNYQKNPSSGRVHRFLAYRVKGVEGPHVTFKKFNY